MLNQAMARKLKAREAIDVETISVPQRPASLGNPLLRGVFQLDPAKFHPDLDYCVVSTEQWIWSIGKNAEGEIFASIDTRFYGAEASGFECLWLR